MAGEESPKERETTLLQLILAQQKVIAVNCRFLTHTRVGDGVTLSQLAIMDKSPASQSLYDKVLVPRCETVHKAITGLVSLCVTYSAVYPKAEPSSTLRACARKLKRAVSQTLHHVLNPEKSELRQQNNIIAAYIQLTSHSLNLKRLLDARLFQLEEESSDRQRTRLRALTASSLEMNSGSSNDTMEHRIKQILARVYQLSFSMEGLTEQLRCYYTVKDKYLAEEDPKTLEEKRERIRVALEEENVPYEELERDMTWEALQQATHSKRTVTLALQKVLASSDRAQSDLAEVVSLLRSYATQQWPSAEEDSRDELLSFWALISEMRVSAAQFIHGLRIALLSEDDAGKETAEDLQAEEPKKEEETPIPSSLKSRMSVRFHLNDWEGRMQLLKLETMQLAEQQKQVVLELEQVQQHRQLAAMQLKELQREESAILNKQLQMHRAAAIKRSRLEDNLKAKQELLSRMEFSIHQTEHILHINNIRLLRHEQQLTQKIEQLHQQLELGHRRQLKESFTEEEEEEEESLDESEGTSPGGLNVSRANLPAQLERLREKHKKGTSSGSESEPETAEKAEEEESEGTVSDTGAGTESESKSPREASPRRSPRLRSASKAGLSKLDGVSVSASSVTRHVANSEAKLKQLEAEQAVLMDKKMIHQQQVQVHERHKGKFRVLQAQVQALEADLSEEETMRQNHTQVLARKEQSETQEVKQRQYALLHAMRKMRFAEKTLIEKIGAIKTKLVEHKEFLNAMLKDRLTAETSRRQELLKKELEQQREKEEEREKENASFRSLLVDANQRFSSSFKLLLESMIAKLKETANDDHGEASEEDVNIWQEQQTSTGEERTVLYADDSEQAIKAGTLNQLVIQLTDEKRHDLSFVKTFITTFSSFTTPETLFKKLVQRYEVPQAPTGDVSEAQWKQNVVLPIQLRVFNVLRIWMDMRFSDFDYRMLKMLNSFIDDHLRKDGHAKMAKNIAAIVKRKIAQAEDEDKQIVLPTLSIIADHSPTERMTKVEQLNAMPEELLAKCLTAIEFENFRKIEPQELLNQAWTKAKYRYRARNILKMIENFNMVSGWVALSICCPERLRARTSALVRFIKLAQCLYEPLHNFSTLMAVMAGISSAAVHRLKYTSEDVPKKWKEALESLQALMSSTKSYKNYRTALQRTSPPTVPYTGIWLTDLVFIDDGNPNTISGLINFRKREMTYKIIEDIQQYAQTPYNFGELDRNALDLVANLPGMDEEELWELSQKREPRGKDRSELVQ